MMQKDTQYIIQQVRNWEYDTKISKGIRQWLILCGKTNNKREVCLIDVIEDWTIGGLESGKIFMFIDGKQQGTIPQEVFDSIHEIAKDRSKKKYLITVYTANDASWDATLKNFKERNRFKLQEGGYEERIIDGVQSPETIVLSELDDKC